MKSIVLHVLVDTKDAEDVFRDIEISAKATLTDLHHAILNAFEFSGQEMASFYEADADWDKGQEYPQMPMDESQDAYAMNTTTVDKIFSTAGSKAIYMYDFLKMWCFLIEVLNIKDASEITKPTVLLSVGTAPKESDKNLSDQQFEGEGGIDSWDDEAEDDYEGDFESYNDDSYY